MQIAEITGKDVVINDLQKLEKEKPAIDKAEHAPIEAFAKKHKLSVEAATAIKDLGDKLYNLGSGQAENAERIHYVETGGKEFQAQKSQQKGGRE